jgi:hypothetical protein
MVEISTYWSCLVSWVEVGIVFEALMFARVANTPHSSPSTPHPITLSIDSTVHIIKMFFQGDLQSGISKAVQEAKLVACFVTGRDTSEVAAPPFASDMCLQIMAKRANYGKMNFCKRKL